MLTAMLHCYWLEGQSVPKKGQMVAMTDFFGTDMDFKSESCLSFELEKHCPTQKRKMVSDQQILSVCN